MRLLRVVPKSSVRRLSPLRLWPFLLCPGWCRTSSKSGTSFGLRLEDAHLPPHFGGSQDRNIARANMLRCQNLFAIQDLHVIFNCVYQLNGQPFRRVKNQLNIVCAVSITRLNPKLCLLPNRVCQLLFGRADEIRDRADPLDSARMPR